MAAGWSGNAGCCGTRAWKLDIAGREGVARRPIDRIRCSALATHRGMAASVVHPSRSVLSLPLPKKRFAHRFRVEVEFGLPRGAGLAAFGSPTKCARIGPGRKPGSEAAPRRSTGALAFKGPKN